MGFGSSQTTSVPTPSRFRNDIGEQHCCGAARWFPLRTSSDSSALKSTDSSLRDRAVVSPMAAAVLLLGQSDCDTDMTASGV
jgi:hypothetical protein